MAKAVEAFRTISEVADDLGIHKHVLRFWEVKFNQIRPMKRGGGRRYYRPEDMELLRGIRQLLHRDGYTIKGVQKILREQGVEAVKVRARGDDEAATSSGPAEAPAAAAEAVQSRTPAAKPSRRKSKAEAAPDIDMKEVVLAAIAELHGLKDLLTGTTAGATAVAEAAPSGRRATKAAAKSRRSA